MREKVRHWYAQEVEKHLQAGTAENDVKINMGMPVMSWSKVADCTLRQITHEDEHCD